MLTARDSHEIAQAIKACATDIENRLAREQVEGWTNAETHMLHLWLSNDKASCDARSRIVREGTSETPATWQTAQALREYVESTLIDRAHRSLENTMARDLLTVALNRVDWRELIEFTRGEQELNPDT